MPALASAQLPAILGLLSADQRRPDWVAPLALRSPSMTAAFMRSCFQALGKTDVCTEAYAAGPGYGWEMTG